MRFLTAVALAVVMLWVPVDGVAQRDPLKGLTGMYQRVHVNWNDNIEGKSEAQYTQELETAFELGLLRTGIKLLELSELTPSQGYVECRVNLITRLGSNDVSFNIRVMYVEGIVPSAPGLDGTATRREHYQTAVTWEDGGTGMTSSTLSGADMGEMCVEDFELAWRRANN